MSNSADMMMRCPACNTGFFDAIAYQVHQANCRAAMSCPSCAEKDAEIERLRCRIKTWADHVSFDAEREDDSRVKSTLWGVYWTVQGILRGGDE